jgi:hypothetical protein
MKNPRSQHLGVGNERAVENPPRGRFWPLPSHGVQISRRMVEAKHPLGSPSNSPSASPACSRPLAIEGPSRWPDHRSPGWWTGGE